VETGNLWEAARALARGRLAAHAAPPGPDGAGKPPFTARGPWGTRRAAARRVGRLWRLAYGPTPVRVRPSEWRGLLADLDRVDADLASGTLRPSGTRPGTQPAA
jgi:hypothetical protein